MRQVRKQLEHVSDIVVNSRRWRRLSRGGEFRLMDYLFVIDEQHDNILAAVRAVTYYMPLPQREVK